MTIFHFLDLYFSLLNLFQPSVALHIETSHLIYCANVMTSFYMKRNAGLKWGVGKTKPSHLVTYLMATKHLSLIFSCGVQRKINSAFLPLHEKYLNTEFLQSEYTDQKKLLYLGIFHAACWICLWLQKFFCLKYCFVFFFNLIIYFNLVLFLFFVCSFLVFFLCFFCFLFLK